MLLSHIPNRLNKWLDVIEAGIEKRGGAFHFGDTPTYVDFIALSVVNTLEFAFEDGNGVKAAIAAHPRIVAALDHLKGRPRISAFYGSERALPKLPAIYKVQAN